ncbi:hypothetical protein HNQ36_000231 [Afipia massiliensis]|uniref:YdhG-like domain-containing protein n=1 Tax=Afipia massiliensis TaxID=211460 RepID=A0A840MQL3_9BRAD|nr:hypothetical protein [Afipia massiliensis]
MTKAATSSKTAKDGSGEDSPSRMIDAKIRKLGDWRGVTLANVRKAILDADKEIIEEWKWMGSPVWERDGIIAVGNAHKDKVKLTFAHGASLPDPDKLFNAGLDGKVWRAIDVFEGDKIDGRALKKLVRAAIEFNQSKKAKKKAVAKVAKKTSAITRTKAPKQEGLKRKPRGKFRQGDFSEINITSLIPEVGAQVADFSIAFAKLSVQGNEENAEPAGSGALIAVGSIRGILTAAHVLRKLPDSGELGLIRFTKSPLVQKQTIDMSLAEKLIIGEDHKDDDEPRAPDMGFLRLAPNQAAALSATNVFFNLKKREESILGGNLRSENYFEGLSGVIAEWTIENLTGEAGFRRLKGFRGLFGVGYVSGSSERDGYDLVDFQVTYDENTKAPYDYGGMSGGALWRVYINKDNDGRLSISDKQIVGFAFHQSKLVNGSRTITCHGMRSVYGHLIQEIQSRWPVV